MLFQQWTHIFLGITPSEAFDFATKKTDSSKLQSRISTGKHSQPAHADRMIKYIIKLYVFFNILVVIMGSDMIIP